VIFYLFGDIKRKLIGTNFADTGALMDKLMALAAEISADTRESVFF